MKARKRPYSRLSFEPVLATQRSFEFGITEVRKRPFSKIARNSRPLKTLYFMTIRRMKSVRSVRLSE
jgi:hypothetical protein